MVGKTEMMAPGAVRKPPGDIKAEMCFKRDRSANNLLKHRLLPLLVALLIPPSGGFCADTLSDFPSLLEAEIVAYKQGDYKMSLGCGIYALKVQPNDPLARYFVAGSLVKLNRKDEAIQQYKETATLTRDPKLLEYIKLALSNLTAASASPAAKPSASKSEDTKTADEETKSVPKDLSAAQQQTLDQEKSDIEARRKEADRAIAKIHEEEAVQLSAIEQYQWKETEDHGRVVRSYEQSRAYTDLFEKLKKENEPRISEINERFLKEKAQIENTAKLRTDAYANASTNEKTQQKMGNGLTQVMPLGSNLYIRNIINYGTDNRLPELKARMQSLNDVTSIPPVSKSPSSGTTTAK
jgi:hypothetical protein